MPLHCTNNIKATEPYSEFSYKDNSDSSWQIALVLYYYVHQLSLGIKLGSSPVVDAELTVEHDSTK